MGLFSVLTLSISVSTPISWRIPSSQRSISVTCKDLTQHVCVHIVKDAYTLSGDISENMARRYSVNEITNLVVYNRRLHVMPGYLCNRLLSKSWGMEPDMSAVTCSSQSYMDTAAGAAAVSCWLS